MKNILLSLTVVFTVLYLSIDKPKYAHTNSSGAPISKTGSPGDNGQTCTSCHMQTIPSEGNNLVISELTGTEFFEPGVTYTFQVSVEGTVSTMFGFEATVENEFGQKIGQLGVVENTTQLIGSGNFITHTSSGTMGEGNTLFWVFDWQAPDDYEGTAILYAAALAANGNGMNSGDITLTNQYIMDFNSISIDVFGCTDFSASNFNPLATIDDGSCQYDDCTSISVQIDLSLYPEETSWDIVNGLDEIILSGAGVSTIEEACLPYGVYTFNAYDDYGDGWNSGVYEVSTICNDILILANLNGTSPTGSGSSEQFLVEECTPCTGFEVEVVSTYESEENASDASASLNITLGTAPYDFDWSIGTSSNPTTDTVNGLTSGNYTLVVTDVLGCEEIVNFDIQVDPGEYLINDYIDLVACNGLFYDTGGPTGNTSSTDNEIIRICPDEEGYYSQLEFLQFDIGWSGTMTIYDGMGTSNTVLAIGNSTNLLGQVITATLENSSGCLTVTFTGGIFTGTGWEALLSCYDYIIYGCTDLEAFNYDNSAEEDDGSCYYQPGCTDDTFVEYYTQGFIADFDNGDCQELLVDDCMNQEALNYNPNATFNLDSDPCIYDLEDWNCGMHYNDFRDLNTYPTILINNVCWMAENLRYLPDGLDVIALNQGGVGSQLSDGYVYTGENDYNISENGRYYSWLSASDAVPYAWHIPTKIEMESLIEAPENGLSLQIGGNSGFEAVMSGGATLTTGDITFTNIGTTAWYWTSNEEDNQLAYVATLIQGEPSFQVSPMPKEFGVSVRAVFGFPEDAILGCTDIDYVEYSSEANYDDGSCETLILLGCTDELALNYDSTATVDDNSCIPNIEGCTDDGFIEYNEMATVDDGSCEVIVILGCTDANSQNYEESANTDDGSCIAHILGCTDPDYAEFDLNATLDDGSCLITAVFGCMDNTAFNYNDAANVDDGSCISYIQGCTDSNYVEFNSLANTDDGSCMTQVILGCTIDYALNFDPLANTDDGSCSVEGCTNDQYVEYDENATIDNGTCIIIAILGCMDQLYIEYYPPANMDDGSCQELIVEGCTNEMYLEFLPEANIDDGSCTNLAIVGCIDSNYVEYNPEATIDDNSCAELIIEGCTNTNYLEFNSDANTHNEAMCQNVIVYGCTDPDFIEYSEDANLDDGSCVTVVLYGCTDSTFTQYNTLANIDDGSCETLVVLGCIDALAINYNPSANTDDGTCIPELVGCMDDNFIEYNEEANISDNSLCITPVVFGCTDMNGFNFDPEANTDDGSCILQFVVIEYEQFANGIVEFTPIITGLGPDYFVMWDFGDGLFSNDEISTHQFSYNDLFEVTVQVSNNDINVQASIEIEILNSTFSIDDLSSQKTIESITFYDLMGRIVLPLSRVKSQIYLKKIVYDDGTTIYLKTIF